MIRRRLGSSGLEVSVLGFGAMNFGASQFVGVGGIALDEARSLVDRALAAGIDLFDTADIYSAGQSEEILGAALGARRREVVLATKVFGRSGPSPAQRGLSRRHIVASCEDSLRRLGTDWIDLYQSHGWDGVVDVEESLRAFDDLISAGKVRYIGCSNHQGWQLMKALGTSERHGLARYVSQQVQYSLLARDFEHELLPCALSERVGGLIWGPLKEGYLTGKYAAPEGAGRLTEAGRLAAIDTERGRATVETLRAIAGERGDGATPARLAIVWLLRKPGVTSVLVGPKTAEQLEDYVAAAAIALSDAEMGRLDAVSAIALTYPLSHQRMASPDRNPAPPAAVDYRPE